MKKYLGNKKAIAAFTLPTLFFFVLLELVPIVWSMCYTFFNGQPGINFEFVGIKNFIKLTKDSRLWTTVGNNLVMTIAVATGQIVLGFILACLIQRCVRGKWQNLVRTLLFIPVILPGVAAAQLWTKIYAITPNYGILNSLLDLLGLQWLIRAWIGDVSTAMGALIAVGIWKSFGMYVLLFYSGLINLSEDMLEAAAIDGASTFQTVFRIQMPLMKPILRMSLIMILTACFKEYDMTVALTNGGPGTTTLMPTMYMFSTAFTSRNFGYGCVIALVTLVECLIVTGLVNLLLSKDNTMEAPKKHERK